MCKVPVLLQRVLFAGLISATQVRAQETDPLASHRRAVLAAKAAFDSARERVQRSETRNATLPVIRRYGTLMLRGDTTVVPRGVVAAIDSGFADAFRHAQPILGSGLDSLLLGESFSITPAEEGLPPAERGGAKSGTALERFELRSAFRHPILYVLVEAHRPDEERISYSVTDWLGTKAGDRLPERLRRWVQNYVPLHVNDAAMDRLTFMQMRRGIHPVTGACLDGSLAACKSSLAIVAGDDTVAAWYDLETRRRIAIDASRASIRWGPGFRETADDCIVRRSDSACTAVMSWAHNVTLVPRDAHRDVLARALKQGGDGAFTRVMQGPESEDIGTLLARAAGAPVDSAVSDWRRSVLASRTPSPAPNGREVVILFAFTAAVAGFATGRRP
ncbi:MAG TPA: hypothetical protein VE967_16310 [Gemmatimonadaceae bacterium]|nr:hypothetical protein [Gemmatimonadaceae bacterium]